jgi:hypothetical protein
MNSFLQKKLQVILNIYLDKRQEYQSKFELFRTDEVEKEFYSSITGKIKILKFEEYLVKIKENSKIDENLFFYRQKYNVLEENFEPDLVPLKCCGKYFNPDDPFLQCKDRNCKVFIHRACFNKFTIKLCPNCSCKLDSESNPNSLSKNQNTIIDLIGKKRDRKDKEVL